MTASDIYNSTDIVMKVRPPNFDIEVPLLRDGPYTPYADPPDRAYLKVGSTMISFVWPAQNKPLVQKLAEKNMTLFAMDAIPRISRAQGP